MDSVAICNMALMAAGIPPITTFDENNDNARLCKDFFPVLRDRVLRDHTWSFATAYFELQQLSEKSPDPSYPIACVLPGDTIRVIGLTDNSPYRRTDNRILIAAYPATLVYIRRVEDPNLFDASFVEALQNLISSEVALSSSRDIQQAQYFRNEYERKLAVARSIDSQENSHIHQNEYRYSSFVAARSGNYGTPGRNKTVFVTGNAGKQG